MTAQTITHPGGYSHHPNGWALNLPRGLDTVDRVLRGPDTYPEPDGWPAVEAVLVGLAGVEPLLVAPGGPLHGFDPLLMVDPRHRALWHAYERVRAAGDDVRQLDVLGAALAAVDCPTPAEVVAYVRALWAEYPASLGVNVTRARALLVERDTLTRELEATAERARAAGVLPRLEVVTTPQATPEPRVSKLAVRGMETGKLDTAPQATSGGGLGGASASTAAGRHATTTEGAPVHTRCPSPYHRTYYAADSGTLETHAVACERRGCPYCGPRWVAAHVDATVVGLGGSDAWHLTAPADDVSALLKRVARSHGEYRRVPSPDRAEVLLVTSTPLPGAERVRAADVPALLEPALEAIRGVRGVKASASRGWSLAEAERTVEALEPQGEYIGNTRDLERLERVLVSWCGATVERITRASGYRDVRATGVTQHAVDTLLRNGIVNHPEAVRLERAERARRRERERVDAAALAERVAERVRARVVA